MIKTLLIAFKAFCFDFDGNYLDELELDQNLDGSYEIVSDRFHYHVERDSDIDGLIWLPTMPESVCKIQRTMSL